MEGAARFMGIDLVNEKELVLIVSRTSEKNAIMKAIKMCIRDRKGTLQALPQAAQTASNI